MKALNLGCGERFHPDWTNLDYAPSHPEVRPHDLRTGIPFSDETFEVVYHSHVLEHFEPTAGLHFLKECRRVLRPGGIIRVAVPDLERIARMYIEALEKAFAGDPEFEWRHEWAVIEMYDQTVRNVSGGQMLPFALKAPESQVSFLRARLGGEYERMMPDPESPSRSHNQHTQVRPLLERLRQKMLHLLIGTEGVFAYDQGRFRCSGEIHQWMYDRFSLAKALENSGFANVEQAGAAESRIAGWSAFCLDTEPDGRIYKPDSLFMEASRP